MRIKLRDRPRMRSGVGFRERAFSYATSVVAIADLVASLAWPVRLLGLFCPARACLIPRMGIGLSGLSKSHMTGACNHRICGASPTAAAKETRVPRGYAASRLLTRVGQGRTSPRRYRPPAPRCATRSRAPDEFDHSGRCPLHGPCGLSRSGLESCPICRHLHGPDVRR